MWLSVFVFLQAGITAGGEMMGKIGGTLDGMNADIDDSHSLLRAFGGQVFWDRMWIGGALLVYCLTLAYVVYRRTGM